jgi:hypothetical protein
MAVSTWTHTRIKGMFEIAQAIEENVNTYLKLGAREMTITVICTSPHDQDYRSDWFVMLAYHRPGDDSES